MKNLSRFAFLFISLLGGLCSTAQVAAQVTLEPLWVAENLKVPESVLVYRDGKSNFLLVSQIDGDPSTADGAGGIAKLTMSGEVDDAEWVTGLNAPKGMAFVDGKLYVADINQIVIINIKKAAVEQRIAVPGSVFLNDVTVDSAGTVYVSDTRVNKVYRLKNGVVDEYLNNVESANGLKSLGANLVVGAGTHLVLVDKDKNRLKIANGFAQPIDGIEPINRGDFLVSCWQGLVYYVHLDGRLELLIDSQKEKINTADIGYDASTRTLFVPNFSKNTVSAYKVDSHQ